MDAVEYFRAYVGMARLDEDFEDFSFEYNQYADETEEEAVERWIQEQGCYIEHEDGSVSIDYEQAERIHPTLAKLLKIREEAILHSSLDELVRLGILSQSVDETGEPIFALTEGYEEKAEEYNRNKEDN